MIAFTLIGTNDASKALPFYDALLAEVGAKRAAEVDRIVLYAGPEGGTMFGVAEPQNGEPACIGNGSMTALAANSSSDVDRIHAKAIELGATSEGDPGPRENAGLQFYGGYFRDLDGNKFNVFNPK